MSMIDAIASYSTAMSTVQARSEAAIKVAKIAQGQGQVAADLVSAALESVEEMVSEFAADAGSNLDLLA